MSDDSRASRLRSRRGKARERVEAQQAEAEEREHEMSADESATDAEQSAGGTGATDTVGEPDGSTADGGDTTDGSVKDERVGTYMYLPESQKRELERVYGTLKVQYEYEFDEEFEKNRHFFPAVVRHGLETLDGMDVHDVRDVVADLD